MKALIEKGVTFLHPESTWIGDDVDADRIAASTVIHPGCRISGAATSMGPDCVIGEEAPATIDNCQLAGAVHLKGGYHSNSVFLDNVCVASSAHIRPCCILEESVTCGHAVGLKQTLLLPFVTLGSVINFCDCLMAGGTDRANHSEVGSSFVHFNFSPHGHKATSSLIGDVPQGVMLDRPPIFLGGQGGIVGPISVDYGTISAAGTILRRDVMKSNQLILGDPDLRLGSSNFDPDHFGSITQTVNANVTYIANLHAMRAWYSSIRRTFSSPPHHRYCYEAAERYLGLMINERIERMTDLAKRISASAEQRSDPLSIEQRDFLRKWNDCKSLISESESFEGTSHLRDRFLKSISITETDDTSYIEYIKSFKSGTKSAGSAWLNSLVEEIVTIWLEQEEG